MLLIQHTKNLKMYNAKVNLIQLIRNAELTEVTNAEAII